MNRFRPNIVVSGPELEAYEEDYWRQLTIGQLEAFVVRACARCPIPDTDQATGIRPATRFVKAALRESDRAGVDTSDPALPKGEFFGQNLNHVFVPGTTIRVGEKVIVTSRSTVRNFQS